MEHADWHTPQIDSIGFEKIAYHPDNPAKEPHPRIRDGWLEVIIKNGGENPFYPEEHVYAYTFIRTTEGPKLGFNGTNGVRYIVIEEGEELIEGTVEEDAQDVPGRGIVFGLWFRFVVRTPAGRNRQVRCLIRQMQRMQTAPN